MAYQITLFKLDSDGNVDSKYECECSTRWNAEEMYDLISRGVKGYHQLWLVDTEKDICIRSSEVSRDRVGPTMAWK